MSARTPEFRQEHGRDAAIAFVTLLGVMAGHALLETARDALFLSRLPAGHLPWAYIAIAVLSITVVGASRRFVARRSRRVVLSLLLAGGGAVTASFRLFVTPPSSNALLALYVWTGLLASVVVVEFWLLVAHVLDFGQAKRLFALIGAGGLTGAILGSVLAFAILWVAPPAALLTAAGVILGLTSVAPLLFSRDRQPPGRRATDRGGSWLELLGREPYLRRLLAAALASSMLFTGVDFVFKATASTDLAPEQLGPFFARFYGTIGVVALLVQLFVAPRLLRTLGVNGSLLLLPTLLLLGSGAFVALGSLGAVLLLRGADGALRHSLHRTGTEILYVPLVASLRDRSKGLIEALGQRGGQAVASVLLLLCLSVGARPQHVGLGLVALAGVWLVATAALRPQYIELFRRNLREGVLETHVEAPDLDLHSFEALIGALGSENDLEVLGALDLLANYGKSNLVPALILYHPSPEVVLRAFALFAAAGRQDVDRLLDRLIRHDDERIRAAALRYSAARAGGALLGGMTEDPSPLVRTTALVELIRRGTIDEWKGGDLLRGIIDGSSSEARRALAIAARDLPPGRYSWALIRLAFVGEPGLALDATRSMAAAPHVEFVPALVRLLGQRECREHARAAILALGGPALGTLGQMLADRSLPRRVRRHLPRTISRFGGQDASRLLEERALSETDERIALVIARALARLRAQDPALSVDGRALLERARATLERAVTVLYFRVTVDRIGQNAPDLQSPAADMLSALLGDIETGALERVFRILTIVNPSEDFGILFAGLRSSDPGIRENGRELLSHVAPEPLRGGILAMLGDGAPEVRLGQASRFYHPPGWGSLEHALARHTDGARPDSRAVEELRRTHHFCLQAMLLDTNDALRGVARHRLEELGDDTLGARGDAGPQNGISRAEISDPFDPDLGEVSRAG